MLILEILLELKSKQEDITAAFLHTGLEEIENVFVEMLLDFGKKDKVLKLKRTVYGLCKALMHLGSVSLIKLEALEMSQFK